MISLQVSSSSELSSHLSSNTTAALLRNSFSGCGVDWVGCYFKLQGYWGLSYFVAAQLFYTGLSISDSLKSVRKSVLIYETIIIIYVKIYETRQLWRKIQARGIKYGKDSRDRDTELQQAAGRRLLLCG